MDYLDNIEDKEAFKEAIKQQLDQIAFGHLNQMKQDLANDFLKGEED
jgi:hypothetical protein